MKIWSSYGASSSQSKINLEQWTIVCDFDKTISTIDVTNAVLEKFAHPSWLDVEDEWIAGKISARECLQKQAALVRANPADMDAFLDTIQIDRHFPAFVALCESYKLPLVVISDGLNYTSKYILKKHGLERLPIISNPFDYVLNRSWRLEADNLPAVCSSGNSVCKCRESRGFYAGKPRCVLIGDGRSDFCLAENAALVFAKDSLQKHCEAKNIKHIAWHNFNEISKLFKFFLSRQQNIGRMNVKEGFINMQPLPPAVIGNYYAVK